ncbi:MAG TPA: glycosyltransferase family 10 [Steroidobacteraceae bacterium]|nr:glycosyltransferase family 10 [Steroidobacteraceae bacterium]
MRVCFVNFWPGAFTEANGAYFLPYVFNLAFGEVEITDDMATADVVVSSVFGQQPVPAAKSIQYIGENHRPNLALHRYALSFDYDPFGGRNFRLPLWWWRLEWPGFAEHWRRRPAPRRQVGHGYEDLIPIDALLRPRPAMEFAHRRFCVLIAGNPEPLRINLFLALRDVGEVVGYGRLFNNPLERSKFELLPQFRFCLCPENGIYPGYHTEKLVDAWFGGCVPLYSGDRFLSRDFNPAALLNYQDFLNASHFCDAVRSLETQANAFEQIYSQPLLLQRPTLEPLIAFLRTALADILRTRAT